MNTNAPSESRLPLQLVLPFTEQLAIGNKLLCLPEEKRLLKDDFILAGMQLEWLAEFGSPRPESSEE